MKTDRFSSKIFVGYELSGELRNLFHESQEWKKHAIVMGSKDTPLVEVPFQEKLYIGFYLEHSITTLQNLRYVEKEIISILKKQCANIDFDRFSFTIFPQTFIS